MNLIDQLDEEYAARYRADQFAAALRSRGCPEECIPSFLADREEQNRQMQMMAQSNVTVDPRLLQNSIRSHYCCADECTEIVPSGVLFCEAHQAEIEMRRRKARSRWRRLFGWLTEGM